MGDATPRVAVARYTVYIVSVVPLHGQLCSYPWSTVHFNLARLAVHVYDVLPPCSSACEA